MRMQKTVEVNATRAIDHAAGTLRKKPFGSFISQPLIKTEPVASSISIASQKIVNPAAGPHFP